MHTRRSITQWVLSAAVMVPGINSVVAGPTRAQAHRTVKVTGPIRGGKRGWPFFAATANLAAMGYMEEEYFVEGVATRYRPVGELTDDGKWTIEPAGTGPFKTRVLVRRPADPAEFNGTVICNWTNVSAGFDVISRDGPGIYENGFAYAAISAQRMGVHGTGDNPIGLAQWDQERYGGLWISGDSFSYDIFSQIARTLAPDRPREGIDPMGGLDVRKLVASGMSQSGGRLITYSNAIQPRDKVFDAIMPVIMASNGAGFFDAPSAVERAAMSPEDQRRFTGRQTRIRDDLATPVMIVNSEAEAERYSPVRQPDTDMFRYWEVAGASHAPQNRDLVSVSARDKIPLGGPNPKNSDVQWSTAADAALQHVQQWVTTGKPPPIQLKIELAGSPAKIVRDQYGNAKGGVRLPRLEAAVASYDGTRNGQGGPKEPFSAELLKKLYPNHAAYVAKVRESAAAAMKAGVLIPSQAQREIQQAERAPIPA